MKAMVFPVSMYRCERWTIKGAECWRIDAFELWCEKTPWESLGLQGDPTSQSWRELILKSHWKDWCWSSNTSATWGEELIHEKTLMLGKIEGKRRRGWQRMRCLDGIMDSTVMSLSKVWDMVKDREAWHATVHVVAESLTGLNDWTTTIYAYRHVIYPVFVCVAFVQKCRYILGKYL